MLPMALSPGEIEEMVSRLSRITGVPKSKILKNVDEKKEHPFEPVLIADNLDMKVVTSLEEEKYKLKGITVASRPVRYYREKGLAAHLLGYVGEITTEELKNLSGLGYRIGDLVGKDGVEATYDLSLRGKDGGELIEVDVYGKPIKIAGQLDPIPGKDLILTLDLELQKTVEKSLLHKEGAVIVIDPRNGEILALASSPTYNPDIFARPLSKEEWERIDKKGHPFMNRAISHYPPGSIFKVITLSTVLQEGIAGKDEVIECKGKYTIGDRTATCWRENGHGKVTIIEGLVWSCDIVFYELGLRSGVTLLSKYAKGYGLGEKTGIDLPGEAEGLVPTAAYKKKSFGEEWVKGDSVNMGIGQGYILATPVQMANVYSLIATSQSYIPHVVKEIKDREGKTVFNYEPKILRKAPISQENLNLIAETLREVIKRGTGVAARISGIPASGKTGTAENPKEPHAWFICYAPYKNPEILIVSFIAHGEHGDRVTAYIARDILAWYKKNRLQREVAETEEKFEQYIQHPGYREIYRP